MDLMDDSLFAPSCPPSVTLPASVSVAEKERFRLGDKNEAGDIDDCLSDMAAVIEDIGGRRLSSLRGLVTFREKPRDW